MIRRGIRLEFYFPEGTKHKHVLLHEWLFDAARWAGITGGAMYKAEAGYGRHGELRDEGLFDLKGSQPMMACFICDTALAQKFLDYLATEQLELFYTRAEVEYGVVGQGL